MDQWIKRDKESLIQIYDTQPVVFTGAEGMFLIDNNGKRYLDFSAQFSSCSLGHGNAELIDAGGKTDAKACLRYLYVCDGRARAAGGKAQIHCTRGAWIR